jgi:hypothetical protein
MDTETAAAVDTLRTDIHRVESKVEHVETSLTAKIVRVETSLTAEIARVETGLTAEIHRVETSLTAKMFELNEETKRHADVQFDSLRDDIRMVAEAVVALGTKVDSLRR